MLRVGGIAYPNRPRVRVAAEMVKLVLVEFSFARDSVHDLQVFVAGGHIGDEREEVDRLPVEAEGVHGPQRERGVTDPGVAVVVVALAPEGFRKRRRRGCSDGTSRREG